MTSETRELEEWTLKLKMELKAGPQFSGSKLMGVCGGAERTRCGLGPVGCCKGYVKAS